MSKVTLLVSLIFGVLAAGCGSSGGGGGDGGMFPDPSGVLTATIDGMEFDGPVADFQYECNDPARPIQIGAADGSIGYQLDLEFNAPPVIPISYSTIEFTGSVFHANVTAPAFWYDCSGTVTITEYELDHIVGTFSFVAKPSGGCGFNQDIVVSNGVFDLPRKDFDQLPAWCN